LSIKANSAPNGAGSCPQILDGFNTNPSRPTSLPNRLCTPALGGAASGKPVSPVALRRSLGRSYELLAGPRVRACAQFGQQDTTDQHVGMRVAAGLTGVA